MEGILRSSVTKVVYQITMIMSAVIRPVFPTTQPSLIYMITPKMVRTDGVYTPAKAPNFFALAMNRIFYASILIIYGNLKETGIVYNI
jgi:hypothetical protein